MARTTCLPVFLIFPCHVQRTLEEMCRDLWNWQSKNPKGCVFPFGKAFRARHPAMHTVPIPTHCHVPLLAATDTLHERRLGCAASKNCRNVIDSTKCKVYQQWLLIVYSTYERARCRGQKEYSKTGDERQVHALISTLSHAVTSHITID